MYVIMYFVVVMCVKKKDTVIILSQISNIWNISNELKIYISHTLDKISFD